MNDLYTQVSNRRYRRTEHVLQGRLKAILADKDSYLFELTRHVVLNPVRADVTRSLSWRASTRKASGPPGDYATGAYSYREIAAHFALHLATVGRIMRT